MPIPPCIIVYYVSVWGTCYFTYGNPGIGTVWVGVRPHFGITVCRLTRAVKGMAMQPRTRRVSCRWSRPLAGRWQGVSHLRALWASGLHGQLALHTQVPVVWLCAVLLLPSGPTKPCVRPQCALLLRRIRGFLCLRAVLSQPSAAAPLHVAADCPLPVAMSVAFWSPLLHLFARRALSSISRSLPCHSSTISLARSHVPSYLLVALLSTPVG